MKKQDITERHFRGITTVEDLKARCLVDDFTECWHWREGMRVDQKGRKTPQLWLFDSVRGVFRSMSGPIAVLELEGTRTPETERAWRTCRCEDCMNPGHVMGGTFKQWGAWLRAHGYWRNQPARIAAGRKVGRGLSGITPEIAAAVRAAPTGRAAAAQFGLTESHASKIRRGKIWANQVAPGASVFTLGAR